MFGLSYIKRPILGDHLKAHKFGFCAFHEKCEKHCGFHEKHCAYEKRMLFERPLARNCNRMFGLS